MTVTRIRRNLHLFIFLGLGVGLLFFELRNSLLPFEQNSRPSRSCPASGACFSVHPAAKESSAMGGEENPKFYHALPHALMRHNLPIG
jgi:hypothetical protein